MKAGFLHIVVVHNHLFLYACKKFSTAKKENHHQGISSRREWEKTRKKQLVPRCQVRQMHTKNAGDAKNSLVKNGLFYCLHAAPLGYYSVKLCEQSATPLFLWLLSIVGG